ncbi:PREDICTED: epoxide hydrolase 1-like [Dipodomys ordii]|uniref:Epoxide hydrolase n=1 Tax=Dipodomys ordii TaxID=10020 RepID=A0A1S3GSN8_DIPOR|nr:PREDICTED: epoxide hydrolase 1-like [Dipodomys ordii]
MWLGVLLALVLGLAVYYWFTARDKEERLPLGDGWWGPGAPPSDTEDQSIRPFKVETSDDEINDLHQRIDRFRWTPPLEDSRFHYGFNSSYLKKVLSYWRNDFDWRKQVELLNQYPHFKTTIEGLDIHFIHVKPTQVPSGRSPEPLMMVHGWPGSFYEFYKIIPLLTDPRSHGLGDQQVFEVICPSIPGYGFSQASSKKVPCAPFAGCALNDSPVGLAAYILEKFSTWTDSSFRGLEDGGLERKFTLDELLTNIMLYWTTGSIVSSQRFYKENLGQGLMAHKHERMKVFVPTGFAAFPSELLHLPEKWVRAKYPRLLSYSYMASGGHFAAFEEPRLLAQDIRKFVAMVGRQ